MYTEELDHTTRKMVQRYKGNHCKATYTEWVQRSKYKDEAVCARKVQSARCSSRSISVVKPGRRTTNLLQSSSGSVTTTTAGEEHGEETLCYMGECPKNEKITYPSTTVTATFGDDVPILSLQPSLCR